MIHVPTVGPPTRGIQLPRKVAAVLLDAMLLDLSRLGHNGLVHNAREDSWQLNERQPQVQSEGWHWVAIGHS